jgi:hypothetical protein
MKNEALCRSENLGIRALIALIATCAMAGCTRPAVRSVPSLAQHPPSSASNGRELARQAEAALAGDKNADALRLYRQAVDAGGLGPLDFYNAACAAARNLDTAAGIRWLGRAVDEGGYDDPSSMRWDPDLEPLFGAAFDAVVARATSNQAKRLRTEGVREVALRAELEALVAEDQAVRARRREKPTDSASKARVEEVTARATARIKQIVHERGWPGTAHVGTAGSHHAWLLVQHADHDVVFQKHALSLLENAVQQGQASGVDLAYLTDRVLVNDGLPQRYGTQFHAIDGAQVPFPIAEPERVDERRSRVGIEMLAEYAKKMNAMHGPE